MVRLVSHGLVSGTPWAYWRNRPSKASLLEQMRQTRLRGFGLCPHEAVGLCMPLPYDHSSLIAAETSARQRGERCYGRAFCFGCHSNTSYVAAWPTQRTKFTVGVGPRLADNASPTASRGWRPAESLCQLLTPVREGVPHVPFWPFCTYPPKVRSRRHVTPGILDPTPHCEFARF